MRLRVLIASPPPDAIGGVAAHSRLLKEGVRGAALFDQRWPFTDRPDSGALRGLMHSLALGRWVGQLLVRRPRVVHLQITDTGVIRDMVYLALARLCRMTVVSHLHSSGFFGPGTAHRDFALRWIVRWSDEVIVLSRPLQTRIGADPRFGSRARLSYLANPVPPLEEPAESGLGTGRGATAFRILCVGELNSDKGQVELARMADRLRAEGRDVVVELVGPWGAMAISDRRLIESSAAVVTPGVLLGRDKTAAYDRADLFVLFSNREAQPLVILEAMSRGLPIVATDTGGVRDMLQSSPGNVIVPIGSTAALESAVWEFLDDPQRCRQAGAMNREFVETHRDVTTHLLSLVDIYRRVSAS